MCAYLLYEAPRMGSSSYVWGACFCSREHFLHCAGAYLVWTAATLTLSRLIWNIWASLVYVSGMKENHGSISTIKIAGVIAEPRSEETRLLQFPACSGHTGCALGLGVTGIAPGSSGQSTVGIQSEVGESASSKDACGFV